MSILQLCYCLIFSRSALYLVVNRSLQWNILMQRRPQDYLYWCMIIFEAENVIYHYAQMLNISSARCILSLLSSVIILLGPGT